jgi:hypothetical protein
MQSLEAALKQPKAGVEGRGIVGAAIDTARQALKPSCSDIMNGEIGGYAEGAQILGGQWRTGHQVGIEFV